MQHLEEGAIHAWIDGQLSADEGRSLEAHLSSCEVCAQLAAEARGFVAASSRILTALDNVPGDVIPIAPPVVIPTQAAGDVTPIGTRPVRRWRTPFWMRTAAAVVVIAGASALVMTAKLNNVGDEATTTAALSLPMDTPAPALEQTDMASVRASAPVPATVAPRVAGAESKSVAMVAPVRTSGANEGRSAATLARSDQPEPKPGQPRSRTEQTRAAGEEREVADRAEARKEELSVQQSKMDAAAGVRQQDYLERPPSPVGVTSRAIAGYDSSRMPAPSAGLAQLKAQVAPPPSSAARRVADRSASAGPRQPAPAGDAFALERGSAAKVGAARRASPEQMLARGCYALTLSPWTGGTIPFGAPPARIELDSLSSVQNVIRGLNLVHPARGAASNGAPLAYWHALGDSVYVTWRDDQRGVMMKLPLYGEVLRGSARTLAMSRSNEPVQSSEVEARRISCRE